MSCEKVGSQISARVARLIDTELHALHELIDLLVFSPLLCRQDHRLGFENIEFTCAQESVEWGLGWIDEMNEWRVGRNALGHCERKGDGWK